MDVSNERLPELVAAADYAYQRARDEVFDQLAPRAAVYPHELTEEQIYALTDLVVAEAELATYREQRLVPPSLQGAMD